MSEFDYEITQEAKEILEDLDPTRIKDGKSADFVENMIGKFKTYGDKTFVTERQLHWLRSLQER